MSWFGRKTGVVFLLFLAVITCRTLAQTVRSNPSTPAIPEGSFIWQRLNVTAGSEISDLLRQQYDQNRKIGSLSGFRLQLYFGSGVQARARAEKVRSDFNGLYPDTKVYLSFKSPDFIVRAGDYRTKSEALKVLKSLTSGFSNAFIVSDDIAFPSSLVAQGETK